MVFKDAHLKSLWSLGSYLNFWFLGSVTGQWTVFIKKVGHWEDWEEGHYANCWTAVIFKGFFGGASQQRKCQSWGNKSLKSVEIDCCAVCDQTITHWSPTPCFCQLFPSILFFIFSVNFPVNFFVNFFCQLFLLTFPLIFPSFIRQFFSSFFYQLFRQIIFWKSCNFWPKNMSLSTVCLVRSVLPTRNLMGWVYSSVCQK